MREKGRKAPALILVEAWLWMAWAADSSPFCIAALGSFAIPVNHTSISGLTRGAALTLRRKAAEARSPHRAPVATFWDQPFNCMSRTSGPSAAAGMNSVAHRMWPREFLKGGAPAVARDHLRKFGKTTPCKVTNLLLAPKSQGVIQAHAASA